MEQPGAASGHQVEQVRQEEQVSVLTTDILFYPSESDPSFFAALAEPKQEGAWGLCAQDGPFPFLADETHDVPAAKDTQSQACWEQVTWLHSAALLQSSTLPFIPKGQDILFHKVDDIV